MNTKHNSHNHKKRHIVRHYAIKHHKAHKRLKELLKYPIQKEKIGKWFFATFIITLTLFITLLSWNKIIIFFTPPTKTQLPQIHSYEKGIQVTLHTHKESEEKYTKKIKNIKTDNSLKSLLTTIMLSKPIEKQLNFTNKT